MEKEFIRFLLHDTEGRIISTNLGEEMAAETHALMLPNIAGFITGIGEEIDGSTHMVEGGYVIERPSLPALVSGPLPFLLDYSAWPGTQILAWNESGDQVFATEKLEITEPGSYRLEITPPWPYRMMEVTLDV